MRRLLLTLVALVLVSSACSAFGQAPAATVDGAEITVSSIDDEIDTIRSNERYTDILEQTYGAPTQGAAGTGTFDAAFVAQVLSLRVWYQAIENDLDERGLLPVPADIRERAEQEMEEQFASLDPDAFAKFPKAYRERLIDQRALVDLVETTITEEIGTDEEAFYEENEDTFAEVCISHVLVGVQGGRTPEEAQAEAQALYESIEDREDFTDLATHSSDDPGAAAGAGELGCGSRIALQFDPTFEQAAFSLEVGEVSEPVQTQFGSHLILVTSRDVPSFDEIGVQQVRAVMSQARDERINDHIVGVICDGDVDVNPRYGTWTAESCNAAVPELPHVEPPEGPRSTDVEESELGL